MTPGIVLLPHPQELDFHSGTLRLDGRKLIALDAPRPPALLFAGRQAARALEDHARVTWDIVSGTAVPADQIGLLITVDGSKGRPQGYSLDIAPGRITIDAHDLQGAFYGVMTLRQIVEQYGSDIPLLAINDWPDMPRRGVMLDISRDKVPTMDTLYALVDRFASWKLNEFQLYTEHTFAYRSHPAVWADASPMTAEEILALDAYCRERHIDLVPNQNSFGHMTRWFEHEPYRALSENPGGYDTAWNRNNKLPVSLSPAHPGTMPFIDDLFDELLPNFSSEYFNVGCDETWDLGQGATKALCDEKGKGRVYLEFLLAIQQRVKKHDRTMMFWGDIIGNHPELVPELPTDSIAMEWGYEADHDFPGKCEMFAGSGIPFYVCPGTSSWNSIAGRTDNAMGNIRSAVENGLKHGAIGCLNTDWGDGGHWQFLPASYLGFAYGAALSWAFQQNKEANVPALLDNFVFEDSAGIMGKLAYDLGNVYQLARYMPHNGSALFWAYRWPLDLLTSSAPPERYSNARKALESIKDLPAVLANILTALDEIMAPITRATMSCPDADLLRDEFMLAADMLRHGVRRIQAIAGETIAAESLASELDALQARYQKLWLARNRPGGLRDSLARMSGRRAMYE